jgi:transcriptional regulator with XRE-family HTH domain
MTDRKFIELGQYLKEKRILKGLTQREVSEKIGCRPQFIMNIERGVASPPWAAMKIMVQMYAISRREIVSTLLRQQEHLIMSELFGMKKSKRA